MSGLTEAQIQQTCVDWLVLDGWRNVRTDPVSDKSRGKGFGELGMADDLFLRYQPNERHYSRADSHALWVEWKSAKGKPSPHQLNWAKLERARGALVWMATVDFPPSIEGFQEYYLKSGLNVRMR